MQETANTTPATTPGKLVLIVEDDRDLAAVVADVLECAGYRAAIAVDGRDAIDRLARGLRPDLILLDMSMPVLDGWGFRAEQVRMAEAASIPVIAITADGDARRKASSIGADGFLGKPVAIDGLLAEVARVAGEP